MVDLSGYLEKLTAEGSRRRLPPLEHPEGGRVILRDEDPQRELLDFSSNDYLGLTRHPLLLVAAAEAMSRWGTGAGSARLMSGNLELHRQLEEALARFKQREAALLFGSGYLANVGAIPALVGRGDVIFSDKLNHASIVDGCRLSGAALHRFPHNDLNRLEELLKQHRGGSEALIVVESLYSMDGDFAPLAQVVELKERYGCRLLVDEAHATGLFGEHGAGLLEESGLSRRVDLILGTLGKALGGYGAYVAGDSRMIEFLLNRARTFIFATALPPAVTATAIAALELLAAEPELRRELWRRVELFKKCLKLGGVEAELGPSQIIPLTVGESKQALDLAAELRQRGIYATAVRPPTVPRGAARLRLSITNHLEPEELNSAAAIIASEFNRM